MTTTCTTYRDGQITVENGLRIKIGVEHKVTADARDITVERIIRKYKQSGNGWRYDPSSTEIESVITLDSSAAPDLVRDLMWAMAIGAEKHTENRLANS